MSKRRGKRSTASNCFGDLRPDFNVLSVVVRWTDTVEKSSTAPIANASSVRLRRILE